MSVVVRRTDWGGAATLGSLPPVSSVPAPGHHCLFAPISFTSVSLWLVFQRFSEALRNSLHDEHTLKVNCTFHTRLFIYFIFLKLPEVYVVESGHF